MSDPTCQRIADQILTEQMAMHNLSNRKAAQQQMEAQMASLHELHESTGPRRSSA